MGDFFMQYDLNQLASAGTSSGIGFYELATSYQQLWIYYGANSTQNDYTPN